jgi:ABC-type antimicrobial peptide transport system permease subunit
VPQLAVRSRADTLAQLQADPLARGALLTLAGTAAVALLLALVGLLLAVVGDVRDDRGELFDLEAQGASPATIRAHLRLRALLVSVFGILGGVALGALLSALVISLVSVTAASAKPEPPLLLSLDLPLLAAAAVGYILIAAVLVFAATALRGRAPARAAEVAA